jgi:hypothetical protein
MSFLGASMADFEVWIRTHLPRLDAAFQLKALAGAFLSDHVTLLNTGGSSAHYSQRFIMCLDAELARPSACEYVLILEDDVRFTPEAREVLAEATRVELAHVWLTLPNAAAYALSQPLWGAFRRLRIANNFYYSGAVLVRRELLREFVFEYLLTHLDHALPNFDVHVSAFLARQNGGDLLTAPGFFGSDPSIPSSISSAYGNAHPLRTEAHASIDPQFLLHRSVRRLPSAEGCGVVGPM